MAISLPQVVFSSLNRLALREPDVAGDDRSIQGWVVRPPEFDPKKKYPLILEIHDGPFANYGLRFAADMQLYAARHQVDLVMAGH
jgi:hypothetical protein